MQSPVVLDKPPEYGNGNERGFPFEEDDSSSSAGAWRDLAARHPDIAARLRARPQTWARKRRPSHQANEEFGDDFSNFDRFPFDDIPPEFRGHFPSHWDRRFDDQQSTSQPPPPPPQQQQPTHVTISTQTEPDAPEQEHTQEGTPIPQYGLRNTVDLGQKSAVDPSLVDEQERSQRSMSAPPETREQSSTASKMSGQTPPHAEGGEQHSNVRHIPIFVEGRDEPVINKRDFAESKPAPQPHPEPHREQYFPDESVNFHHPPNFGRAFGAPFNKGFRQGPQPFSQQKVYPQAAYGRAASPQRAQSPRQHDEFVKVPVHHDAPDHPSRQPQQPHQQQHKPQPPPAAAQPQPQPSPPPPKPQPTPNDPITQILAIQTDVLNLMTDVENFAGAKNDKAYLFLDEMLTRNLIKLDNIETDGKENIRQARKEAIRCIQKCIAVLEAKAEKNAQAAAAQPDVEMAPTEQNAENGEVEMKENAKEVAEDKVQSESAEPQTVASDTRPESTAEATPEDAKKTPKKKIVKKRDKSKDKKAADESMQMDDKGDKSNQNTQAMDVDAAASQ